MTRRNRSIVQFGRAQCLLAALFTAALALLALGMAAPASAQAAEVTDPIVIEDATQPYQGDGWAWTSAGSSGTLTLTNANIHIPANTARSAVVVPDGATIHLVGENTITLDAASSEELYFAGIEAQGDLSITGDASASLEIIANGNLSWGIGCEGDLTISAVELNVAATTVDVPNNLGSEGIIASGNVVINADATVATVGSEYGLRTEGGLNITDAGLVKFGVENTVFNGSALYVQGETMIADVSDEVVIEGSRAIFQGMATISNSELTAHVNTIDGAIAANGGLEIVDRSRVSVASEGIVMDVTGSMLVENADLRSEGIGTRSMALRMNGDLTIADATVTALGDDAESTVGINIIPNQTVSGIEDRGTLTLSGNPSLTAEGTQFAIAFWAFEEQWSNDPVILDPAVGALEGGMLSYAENDFGGKDFVSVWTYAADDLTLTDEIALEGASQRVVFGMESALVFVTDEGQPATGLGTVRATAADGAEYEAVEWLDGSHAGYYRFPHALPDGIYTVEASEGLRTASTTVTIGELPSTVAALELCPSNRFSDVDTAQWYHESIDWAILNGILQGVGDTGRMEPDGAITRAQLATMLWNAEGNPTSQEDIPFTDVTEDDWFAQAVAWAYAEGLFEGYGDTGLFGPDDVLSREQAAIVMMRWEEQRGQDVTGRADLSSFSDESALSDWAHESMAWAVAAGVINGVEQPDGTTALAPQDDCSRAQLATIMMRIFNGAPVTPDA